MSLLKQLGKRPNTSHIYTATAIYNTLSNTRNDLSPPMSVSELAHGLENLLTQWRLINPNFDQGQVKLFKGMIAKLVTDANLSYFMNSPELKDLVFFEPPIMNNDQIINSGHSPGEKLDPTTTKKASFIHRWLKRNFEHWETKPKVLSYVTELLYIVRSNIMHGGKTAEGAHTELIQRNNIVCQKVFPVQLLLLKILLDRPDQKLFTYGTLMPHQPNHNLLAHLCNSQWKKAFAHGIIEKRNDLPVLQYEPAEKGPQICGMLLKSPSLNKSEWEKFDLFEGQQNYKRELIVVHTSDAYVEIANSYVKPD